MKSPTPPHPQPEAPTALGPSPFMMVLPQMQLPHPKQVVRTATQPMGNVPQMTGNMEQRSGQISELQVVNEESTPKEAMGECQGRFSSSLERK